MHIKATYQITAALLTLTFLAGYVLPLNVHGVMMSHCDEMNEVHHSKEQMNHDMSNMMDDCPEMQDENMHHGLPVNNMSHCQTALSCACEYEQPLLTPAVPLTSSVKLSAVSVFSSVLNDLYSEASDTPSPPYYTQVYSPPPIFLANGSFLI